MQGESSEFYFGPFIAQPQRVSWWLWPRDNDSFDRGAELEDPSQDLGRQQPRLSGALVDGEDEGELVGRRERLDTRRHELPGARVAARAAAPAGGEAEGAAGEHHPPIASAPVALPVA